jgi:defect-in-organelle-trafficking protein DotA
MNKFWPFISLMLLPLSLFADSTLSFTPPATDYSVIFLGNLFGIVDGVLHGSGSQIMGEMFGVLNASILAMSGMIVMYTLVVGTMNTAHEGTMLGQKWSSIWIPVKTTCGLAFLIPKASGYCLMQIFIMWVVVQGVGAADKVWNAALDYLNRGGSIMKAQMNTSATSGGSDSTAFIQISKGASTILSGQVCMRGLQLLLEEQQKALIKNGDEFDSGTCSKTNLESASADPDMIYFCKNPVPDFISTVDAIEYQNKTFETSCPDGTSTTSTTGYDLKMPNFKAPPYSDLNGVCGTIHWADFNPDLSGMSTLSCGDIDTTRQSRAVAVQQMYSDLTPVAMEMVDNDPQINKSDITLQSSTHFSDIAKNQYGVPQYTNGGVCSAVSSECTLWAPDTTGDTQALSFTGFEFQDAITDYNGIMLPALNLAEDAQNSDSANDLRAFIQGAKESGWIMAGSYFFDLAYLNGMVTSGSNTIDKTSELDKGSFSVDTFSVDPFADSVCTTTLCKFFGGNTTYVLQLAALIDGNTVNPTLEAVVATVDTEAKAVTGYPSACAYGFITNGSMIHLPGQPGLSTPEFKINFNIQPGNTLISFPKKNFKGHYYALWLDKYLPDVFYNNILRGMINVLASFLVSMFNMVLQGMLYIPLQMLMETFNNGVQMLENNMVHPIIALAYMGASFINMSVDIWINLLAICTVIAMASFLALGIAVVAIFLILPFLASWLGIMVAVGWIDAYYVPFIPYMIFTFGSLAWFMSVTESMVAGPIVALGISHPEGHDALGKAEQAVMILMNVFLRPAMMIIGYIGSIALSYVAVFVLNSGYIHIMKFLLPDSAAYGSEGGSMGSIYGGTGTGSSTPYTNWSAIYASFFCLVTYTSLYLTVVQKSFTLIYILPDKILRWIGSQGESYGQDTAQWTEDIKGQVKETGEASGKSGMQTGGKALEFAESVGTAAAGAAAGGAIGGK